MNIVIYSKDRSMQLELLLRSLINCEYVGHNITIIYTYSNNMYMYGYERVKCLYTSPKWVLEGNFKEDTLRSINPSIDLTMFLMDDMLAVDLCNFSITEKPKKHIISLRLHPGINYSYPAQKEVSYTATEKNVIINGTGCWAYPMSLDGNVFTTELILDKIKTIDFRNPNELEYKLCCNPINLQMRFFDNPCFINIPNNRVQTFCNNVFSSEHFYDQEELNKMFLAGFRIKITPDLLKIGNACHIEKQFEFEKV